MATRSDGYYFRSLERSTDSEQTVPRHDETEHDARRTGKFSPISFSIVDEVSA